MLSRLFFLSVLLIVGACSGDSKCRNREICYYPSQVIPLDVENRDSPLSQMHSGDLNGDGFDELVVSHPMGISIFSGERLAVTDYLQTPGELSDVELMDVNGDGNLELVASLWNTLQVAIYTNNGAGFSEPLLIDFEEFFPKELASLDFDGDSDLDLVVASLSDVLFLENLGGSFLERDRLTLNSVTSVLPGDIDADQDQDLVLGMYNGDIYLVLNEGFWGYKLSTVKIVSSREQDPDVTSVEKNSPALGDLDGDNDLDLFVTHTLNISEPESLHTSVFRQEGVALLLENMGDHFSIQKLTKPEGKIDVPWSFGAPFLSDLDNDSDADILIPSGDGQMVLWNNEGRFENTIPILDSGDDFCSFDANNDGVFELAVLDSDDDYLRILQYRP